MLAVNVSRILTVLPTNAMDASGLKKRSAGFVQAASHCKRQFRLVGIRIERQGTEMNDICFRIEPVRSDDDLRATVDLMLAYAAALGIDLAYQDFDRELADLPGKYAPPSGELLLARDGNGRAVGCVGLRPLSEQGVCEMKRLFVAPEGRGVGLGRALVRAIVASAARIGYSEVRLDTLATMHEAQALYRSEGFQAIAPYYITPVAGTLFMGRSLSATARA